MQAQTVRDFLNEFYDFACESVDIIDVGKRVTHHYDGNKVDTIPESLLDVMIRYYTLCYIPERFAHEIQIFVNTLEEVAG